MLLRDIAFFDAPEPRVLPLPAIESRRYKLNRSSLEIDQSSTDHWISSSNRASKGQGGVATCEQKGLACRGCVFKEDEDSEWPVRVEYTDRDREPLDLCDLTVQMLFEILCSSLFLEFSLSYQPSDTTR